MTRGIRDSSNEEARGRADVQVIEGIYSMQVEVCVKLNQEEFESCGRVGREVSHFFSVLCYTTKLSFFKS